MQYSFGIIDWKISELKKIDTKTRKLSNTHRMLHPKADEERLYIPRKDGGRGLIDVETALETEAIGTKKGNVQSECLSMNHLKPKIQ